MRYALGVAYGLTSPQPKAKRRHELTYASACPPGACWCVGPGVLGSAGERCCECGCCCGVAAGGVDALWDAWVVLDAAGAAPGAPAWEPGAADSFE
jgi:hypothetical protein